MSAQPDFVANLGYEFVANLGDVNPLEHGGYFVYRDKTGVYPPHAELLEPLGKGKWELRRFDLEPCTYVNGVLSDNPFHPDHDAWFADSLDSVASCMGRTADEIRDDLCSDDPIRMAYAYREIGEYYGFENLDSYPETLNRREASERIPTE